MNNTIKEFNTAIKLLDNARLAYENYLELREKALEYISEHIDGRLDQIPSGISFGSNNGVQSVLSYDLNRYLESEDCNFTQIKYAIKDAMNVKDWA